MSLSKTMYPGLVNSPETTTTNDIDSADTLIYVLDPSRVPTAPNQMTLGTGTNAETVLVTEINDSALTVTRGFQGIAKAWPAGTIIARNFTEYDYNALKENVKELDENLGDMAGEGRTTETVKGNATAIAAHLAEIAAHAELTNRTITVGADKDFTTVQAAVDSIKKRVDATITINVDADTYAENVTIAGFYGSGSIIINGGTDLATAANYHVQLFLVRRNGIFIFIKGFDATTAVTRAFEVEDCKHVDMYYCITEAAAAHAGFKATASILNLYTCKASNRAQALHATNGATVISNTWDAGSGNTTGILADYGATVAKNSTQPQGTTAESEVKGGVIR
jgi:hypothetical protein